MHPYNSFRSLFLFVVTVLCLSRTILAQSSSSSSSSVRPPLGSTTSGTGSNASQSTSNTPSPSSVSVSVTSITTSVPVLRSSGTRSLTPTAFVLTTLDISATIPITLSTTTTTSSSTTSTTTSSASATSTHVPGIHLVTKITPAYGVLGVLLILTGLPSAFMGHKNRWSSFFLIGFYTFSLVTFALIVKFGVIGSVHPPSKKLQGLFLLASVVAGIAGGGIGIFFWRYTKYFIGAWGGLAIGFWVQCFRSGGLVGPIGFKWLLYIACAAVGFALCTIPKAHYHILLVSTAVVGASAFMLGVDCFTTAGLKEFYVYNLGFHDLFPKFSSIGKPYPLTQTMQIELGLIAAVAIMGGAVQFRVLTVLQVKLREISNEHKKREAEIEERAAARFDDLEKEREAWEKKHTDRTGAGSTVPLMMADGGSAPNSPGPSDKERPASSLFSFSGTGPGHPAGDYFAGKQASRVSQSPGALPVLDLGSQVKDELPDRLVDATVLRTDEHPEIKEKQDLLASIRDIRRSIDALSTNSYSTTRGTRPSFGDIDAAREATDAVASSKTLGSRRTLTSDPRDRITSMIESTPARPSPAHRPKSVPLNDDWDTYLTERKLFVPPSGITPPIPSSSPPPFEIGPPSSAHLSPPIPEAVTAALTERQRRESWFDLGPKLVDAASDEEYLAPRRVRRSSLGNPLLHRSSTLGPDLESGFDCRRSDIPSTSANVVTVLPPARRRISQQQQGGIPLSPKPSMPRTVTTDELAERHKAKMRALQAPLSKAAEEEARLEEARSRWEKNKAYEKQAMAKREAEKAAEVRMRSADKADGTSGGGGGGGGGQRRSLSIDRLAAMEGTGGRRQSSAIKVEEWQSYQREHGDNSPPSSPVSPSFRRRHRPAPDVPGGERQSRRRHPPS